MLTNPAATPQPASDQLVVLTSPLVVGAATVSTLCFLLAVTLQGPARWAALALVAAGAAGRAFTTRRPAATDDEPGAMALVLAAAAVVVAAALLVLV
jgi:hypothetical protein